jgi:hypothetical protein
MKKTAYGYLWFFKYAYHIPLQQQIQFHTFEINTK